MLTKITYYTILGWMYLHALMPFKVLYILSDILYIFVYKIIGYRIKVVRKNMRMAFPEKTGKELRKLEKEFYHHLCDYFVETMKLLHISEDEMKKRMVYKNMDVLEKAMENGQSNLAYLGHYGNWEWIPSIILMVNPSILTTQIYKPLKNKAIDNIFLKIRSRFGSVGFAKNDTLRNIIRYKKQGRQMLIGLISDQTPPRRNEPYWSTFLGVDTPFFLGVERIAKQTGFSVSYLDITKTGRGRYVCECKLITDNPKEEAQFAITEKYVRLFEETLMRNPAYWLWSHNRWKYKKEDFAS